MKSPLDRAPWPGGGLLIRTVATMPGPDATHRREAKESVRRGRASRATGAAPAGAFPSPRSSPVTARPSAARPWRTWVPARRRDGQHERLSPPHAPWPRGAASPPFVGAPPAGGARQGRLAAPPGRARCLRLRRPRRHLTTRRGREPAPASAPNRRSCSRSANIGGWPARASDEYQKAKPSRGGPP